jgi:titin
VGPNVTPTSFTDSGLTNGTTYYYVVSALNAGGESANSAQASATPADPPAAPSNLTALAASSTEIDLVWIDNSNNEDGFKIEQSTDNVNFTQIAMVAANVTTYASTGLTAVTTYYFRVQLCYLPLSAKLLKRVG